MYEVNKKKSCVVRCVRLQGHRAFHFLAPLADESFNPFFQIYSYYSNPFPVQKKFSVGGSIREIAAGAQNKDSPRLHGSQREKTRESMIKDSFGKGGV